MSKMGPAEAEKVFKLEQNSTCSLVEVEEVDAEGEGAEVADRCPMPQAETAIATTKRTTEPSKFLFLSFMPGSLGPLCRDRSRIDWPHDGGGCAGRR